MEMLIFALIGAVAGIVMGTIGDGGGAITISPLVLFSEFTQRTVQGTTLMIVAAPISFFTAISHYK